MGRECSTNVPEGKRPLGRPPNPIYSHVQSCDNTLQSETVVVANRSSKEQSVLYCPLLPKIVHKL
jgi:hypothetical protein